MGIVVDVWYKDGSVDRADLLYIFDNLYYFRVSTMDYMVRLEEVEKLVHPYDEFRKAQKKDKEEYAWIESK